ncbi:hypothetical protein FRX31_012237 [Thalictrum thalictroides]|uniref:Uncharacterized protein n=1 Tax=Thalictrum thalictroides TaxID=46969 RepID=A0A7J6WLD3_THATH|nr:hypothetical protein FRX31_012237 [Thalictrum thalictroides]
MEENNHEIEAIETNDVFIQIDQDSALVASILSEISPKPPSQCSIFKIPLKFRTKSGDDDAYEPRIVSIGPYHHGKKSFKTTEEHKKWYVHDLISRKGTPNTSLMDFVQAIRELEGHARKCYAEPIILDSNSFVKMMVFDGCFILELLYKYSERGVLWKEEQVEVENNEVDDHKEDIDDGQELGVLQSHSQYNNDPILGTTWMVYSLRKDLVLLENQLPFIVLKKLFDLTYDPSRGVQSLNKLVALFFNPILPTVRAVETNSEGEHILDLLRNHLLPPFQNMEYGDRLYWEYTNSATDLWETGVKFRKKKNAANGLLDITFTDDGVLKIPPFFFGESWTVLLPNLIALEQCRRDYTDQVTSYVILLDSLINSENDVKLLRNAGIIDGLFQEDEKVAVAINNLCKGVVVDRFYYDGLCNRMNAYCKTDWHRWRATLKRDYFNTPWAYFSFLAAVILLLLTLTQTIFSILSYS